MLWRHIGLGCAKRLDTISTSLDSKISGFTRPHVTGFIANLFCGTLESGFKNIRIRCRIRWMRVNGRRIRKEKVSDSKISEYVWTGPKLVVYYRDHGLDGADPSDHSCGTGQVM